MADASCGLAESTDTTGPADLSPLTFESGTWVHRPLSTSVAIDHGDTISCPSEDQRGVARPIDPFGSGTPLCDAGAYEVDAPAVPMPFLPRPWLALCAALLGAALVVGRARYLE